MPEANAPALGRRLTLGILGAGALAAAAAWALGSLPAVHAALAVGGGVLAALVLLRRRARDVLVPRLARVLSVCAIASWVLLVSGQLPATPAGLLQSGALVFAGFSLLCVSGFLHAGERRPRAVRGLDFLLFQAALAVVGVDVGLRWFAEWRPSRLWLPALASPSAQIAAYREEPGAVRFWFPCNSLGFYDDEPPAADDPRPWIACIGDSFVASPVPHPLHFTTVAEGLSGRTIQCFGVSAAGPREYVELLETEVLPREPDSILLALFVGNDVSDSRRIERPWFDRCFHPDNAPLFFFARRLELMRRAPRAANAPARGRVEGDTIYIDTAQGSYHATRKQLVAALPSIAPGLWDPARQRPLLDADEYLKLEQELAQQLCASTSEGWTSFFPTMDRLLAAAAGHEVRVLLIPVAFQVDDALWQQVSANDPALDRDLPQRRIGDYLRARSIPVLDVLPALRAAAARGERTYLLQDTHLDRVGNEIIGRELAAFLESPR